MNNMETPNDNYNEEIRSIANEGQPDITPPKEKDENIRKIEDIDISTDEGKFMFLDAKLAKYITSQQTLLEEATLTGDDDRVIERKKTLNQLDYFKNVLYNKIDINAENGLVGSLHNEMVKSYKKWSDSPTNATEESKILAQDHYYVVSSFESLLLSEMAKRDPNYFGKKEINDLLETNISNAKQKLDKTTRKMDGYFGTDGSIHKFQNPEILSSSAVEEAKIDLARAEQEFKTFGQIMNGYEESVNYIIPPAIKRADLVPIFTNYINDHTNEINKLIIESRKIEKNTLEFKENERKRKILAQERSAAQRLKSKFEVPSNSGDDEGPSMEINTGKTKKSDTSKSDENEEVIPGKEDTQAQKNRRKVEEESRQINGTGGQDNEEYNEMSM